MMSAGWDSRTLLAALEASSRPLLPYSHGDVRGRELRLVERICGSRGLSVRLEPVDATAYDPDGLRNAFKRVESAVFPHWLRAGNVLETMGTTAVTAGVYGEILGGHYGAAMVRSGALGKAVEVAKAAAGHSAAGANGTPEAVLERLRPGSLGVEWCLEDTFVADQRARLLEIGEGIETDLTRLAARGVVGSSRLLEAYISEHRGSQYINAQLLSCRAAVDVALPFADAETLLFTSRVPLESKIHNRLNRSILQRHAPELLAFPTAATFAATNAP